MMYAYRSFVAIINAVFLVGPVLYFTYTGIGLGESKDSSIHYSIIMTIVWIVPVSFFLGILIFQRLFAKQYLQKNKKDDHFFFYYITSEGFLYDTFVEDAGVVGRCCYLPVLIFFASTMACAAAIDLVWESVDSFLENCPSILRKIIFTDVAIVLYCILFLLCVRQECFEAHVICGLLGFLYAFGLRSVWILLKRFQEHTQIIQKVTVKRR